MIWSREELASLSESEFRDQLVIPLFKAMGYQDVRSYHGGSLEQGKDIVMWKADEFGTRRNAAVVVKAERIGGKASTLAGTALTQIHQALGSTFRDDASREELPVHQAFLVNSRDITTEAIESYENALHGAGSGHRVTFLWGDRLWGLLRKYLPQQLLFSTLAEAQRALAESDPHHGCVVQVGPDSANFVVVPKADAPPLQLAFEPQFPDTEHGREQRALFEAFLATGEPAEISQKYLRVHGLPPAMEFLVNASDSGTIRLGPSLYSESLAVALLLQRGDDEPLVLLPYIEFGANRGGREQAILSNSQQKTPFKVSLTVRSPDRPGTFHYDFSEARASAHSQHRALAVQLELSRGGMLLYEDLATGFRYRLFEVAEGELDDPGVDYVELWRHVAIIQRETRTVIPEPEREHFSKADIDQILSVSNLVAEGRFLGSMQSVEITMDASAVRDLLGKLNDGDVGKVEAKLPEYVERILDVDVPLGPFEILYPRARIPADELLRIEAEVAGDELQPHAPVRVRLEAVEGHVPSITFPRWPARRSAGEAV